MTAIPDTGPGLSGFLAHYLWIVYQHFPFEGTWDWLVLFLLLGGVVHFAFLPYVWGWVESDMIYLQKEQATNGGPNQGIPGAMCAFSSMLFFSWFFGTAAGRTFLDGRSFFGDAALTDVDRRVYWISLVVVVALIGLQVTIQNGIDQRNRNTRATRSRPYISRNPGNLYAGGGIFVKEAEGKLEIEIVSSITNIESTCFLLAHLVYWYWSNTSLALMHCFLLSAILTDCARMLFVYILHKRTFG
ncbi:MAG: hypothetical protein AB7U82_13445 [Blastocatellales bacterium]